MKILFRLLAVLVIIAAIGAGVLFYMLNRPYQGFHDQVFLEFPKGTTTSEMATLLQGAGVIEHSWQFLAARAVSSSAVLQAGEYKFEKPASVFDVYKRIARGDIFYYELLVPEGNNLFDIAASLDQLGIFPGKKFLEAARSASLIRDLDPVAPTLEGYLFPNTYRIARHTTPEQLCRLMTGKFREEWRKLGGTGNAHAIVTLASMVEKEAKLPDERPLVASVYHNRLSIGMKLDCDPTTIYAALLDQRYRGKIHRSDLDSTNPYNTYRHPGLPPGPIANPGLGSLKAALQPAESHYLYFVAKADGSGGHTFSETIGEQNAAAAAYHRAEKEQSRQ